MSCHIRDIRPLTGLVLVLALVLGLTTAARAEKYALVRYWLDSPADQEFLRSQTGLDIMRVKPDVHVDIVARPVHLELLRSSGARIDILQDDLTAYYRARLGGEKSNSFGVYHNWEEVVAFVDSLRMMYPHVVSEKWSLGQSHEGRNIWAFRISDNPQIDEPDEAEVLFDSVHHAREVMSSEFTIMFADYLAQNYGSDPEITYLLDTREIYFVPVVNPDGFWYNNWGDMWRKNRRNNGDGSYGVDNNRNYPYNWGYDDIGSSPYTWDATYRGPSPGSEPETQAMMAFINSHEFITHNSYHTSGNLTLYPWGYTSFPTPDDAILSHMAGVMTQYNGYTPEPIYELYPVNGSTVDWSYGAQTEHAKIFCFSNEIGSDGFWPAEANRQPYFEANIWPATYLIRAAASFVAAGNPMVLGGDGNGRLDPGESADLAFLLDNQGINTDATGVAITLSCDDPYLQLASAYREVGTIPAMSSVDLTADPFSVTVDAACPTGRVILITATVTADGHSFDSAFAFPVGAPTMVFSDGFDFSTANWTLTGQWGTTSTTSHSPPNSLTDSPSGNYSDQTNTYAALNNEFYATELSFWHRYDIESGWDYGHVQVAVAEGAWQTVASYTGTDLSWGQVDISLADFSGQPLRIRFLLDTDYSITDDGWYIDDVVLYGSDQSNALPPPPALLTPNPGEIVVGVPALTVANSYDPDGTGPLTYGFRIYGGELGTDLVAAVDGVSEGGDQTSWNAPALANGTYWWRAFAADDQAQGLMGETRSFTVQDAVGVGGHQILGPRMAVLGPVASDRVQIQLELPANDHIVLMVYDARGRLVQQLHSGAMQSGSRILTWNGRDSLGRAVASGVYFARLQTQRHALTKTIVMVR